MLARENVSARAALSFRALAHALVLVNVVTVGSAAKPVLWL